MKIMDILHDTVLPVLSSLMVHLVIVYCKSGGERKRIVSQNSSRPSTRTMCGRSQTPLRTQPQKQKTNMTRVFFTLIYVYNNHPG